MDPEIPEMYIDVLTQEFAYDPVRLPHTKDPAQVLYNRTTLETIWDAKHEAVSPFTRQPFDISNVIPQAELRQEMQQYMVNNSSPTQRLDVISDYTQVLSEAEMRILVEGLISDYECLVNAEREKGEVPEEQYWKVLWKKFNLLRLYCQYQPGNRVAFCSIGGGYETLLPVLDDRFCFLCNRYASSCDALKQVCKEVCRLVDLIGFKDTNIPPDILLGIFTALSCLVTPCDQLKIRSMVLRIYRRMLYDLNMEIHRRSKLDHFCFWIVMLTVRALERGNLSDITNEDLYNGMLILKAGWIKDPLNCIISDSNFVGLVLHSAILCISRLHYLHHATITDECSRSRTLKKKKNEDDEAKNVDIISVALEAGLWLINSILTTTSIEEGDTEFFSESKKTLQKSHIVTEIVRMMELVLAGFKCLGSSHLQFGINIVVALLKEEGSERRRDDVLRVFGDFLGSDMVDEHDSHVKLLLQEFIHSGSASQQP